MRIKNFSPTVRVRRIIPRDSNSLWLATNKGLCYFDLKHERCFYKVPNQNVLNVVNLGDDKILFTTYEKCWVLERGWVFIRKRKRVN